MRLRFKKGMSTEVLISIYIWWSLISQKYFVKLNFLLHTLFQNTEH